MPTPPLIPPVKARYQALVDAGELEPDPAQLALVGRLDALVERLSRVRLATKKSALGWMFRKRPEDSEPLRGLYVWGKVGRGKTMLMDLFFGQVPLRRKRRVHFHEFMAEIHERIHATRALIKAGKIKDADPIPPIAGELAESVRLLCFDEFSVTDIGDAMILGRLFSRLFELGVVVVATSNVEPDRLYEHGLNRGHFLGFIKLLKERVDVVALDARTDFRLEKLERGEVYLRLDGEAATKRLDELWARLTGAPGGAPASLTNKGREIRIPRAAFGAARFSFADLCEMPLGAADYLKIAHAYHTVFIDGIPVLGPDKRNEAKRFINLIDALYDNRVKLVASASAAPDALYKGVNGTEVFEFDRTASRLIEMQSHDYLAAAHGED